MNDHALGPPSMTRLALVFVAVLSASTLLTAVAVGCSGGEGDDASTLLAARPAAVQAA